MRIVIVCALGLAFLFLTAFPGCEEDNPTDPGGGNSGSRVNVYLSWHKQYNDRWECGGTVANPHDKAVKDVRISVKWCAKNMWTDISIVPAHQQRSWTCSIWSQNTYCTGSPSVKSVTDGGFE